jgi:hypothetical protein
MLSKVREHIRERIANLPRRPELAPVPPIRPQAPPTPHELVHGAGDANRDTRNPRRQGKLIARFDYQMHVIPLHRKLHDPEALFVALRGALHRQTHARKHVLAA